MRSSSVAEARDFADEDKGMPQFITPGGWPAAARLFKFCIGTIQPFPAKTAWYSHRQILEMEF
jgi:hypothetical protein